MKIRITKKPSLPKAQAGLNGTSRNSISINGVIYFEGDPGYEQAKKEAADMKIEADAFRAQVGNHFNQPAQNKPMGSTFPTERGTPGAFSAPTTFTGTMPDIAPVAQGPNWGNAIPAVNTNAMVYNNLMGIQPQVGLKNAPQAFTPTGDMTNNYAWASTGEQAVPAMPAGPTMYKTQAAPAADLPAAKKMIGDSSKSLQNTFNTGSAKEIKAGIADFNSTYGTDLKDPRLIKLGAKGRETFGKIGATADKFAMAVGAASAVMGDLEQKRNRKDFQNQMIDNLSSDNMYTQQAATRGDYVQTGMMNGTLRPDEYVANKGMFAEQGGYINQDNMKIRMINRMAYGGQTKGGSLDLGRSPGITQMNQGNYGALGKFMPEVPRDEANTEVEKGETLYGDVDGDGQNEHMMLGGKPHSQGGTPIDAPNGSFIFSKKLKEKDPAVLKMFNKTYKRGGVAYADMAKQYDVNKYKAIMEDPNADDIAKSTAQLMVKNYERKIAQLAMAQEASKGFPQGAPQIVKDNMPQMAAGGYADDNVFGMGSAFMPNMFNVPAPLDVDPYAGGKQKTPTGKDNKFDRGKEYLQNWEQHIPGISKLNNKQAQDKIYDYMVDQNPDAINSMWQNYGLTNEGKKHKDLVALTKNGKFSQQLTPEQLKALKKGYVDGYFGARQLDPSKVPAKAEVGTKYQCTPNGVVAVRYDGPIAGGFEQPGLFNTYEEALAVCQKPGEKEPEKEKPVEEDPIKNVPGKVPFDYMTPDKVNMFVAAANPPKKYNPYYAQTKLNKPEPTFFDPSRELAANAEQYNITTQGLANFAGPQSYMANASGAAGKAFENAANTLGRYNNLNVGVANQFSVGNAEIDNKQALLDAERSNQMYMGNVVANQAYDNSKREYMNNMAKSFGQAWNNRMNLDLINQTIPQYYQDPLTGRTVFKGGNNASNFRAGATGSGPGSQEDWSRLHLEYARAKGNTDLTFNQFLSMTGRGGKSTFTDSNMDGIPDAARYTGANPFYNQNK